MKRLIMRLLGLRREFVDELGRRHTHEKGWQCWYCASEFDKRRIWSAAGFSSAQIKEAARIHRNGVTTGAR